MIRKLISSFNAGEFSPQMWGRLDLESITRGCRLLRNALPMTLGGAFRRPGKMFVGHQYSQDTASRLLPFNFSATQRYQIELAHLVMRFWDGVSGQLVVTPDPPPPGALSTPGTPLVLASPYRAGELFEVQMVQVNDVCFFTHGNHQMRQLSRETANDWRLVEMFEFPGAPTGETGASGVALMEWWNNWQDGFPPFGPDIPADFNTKPQFATEPTGSTDIVTLEMPMLPADQPGGNYMRRIRCDVSVPNTGAYRIYYLASTGLAIWIDGVYIGALFHNEGELWTDHQFVAGQPYKFEIISWAQGPGAVWCLVKIAGPGVPKQVVPTSMLKKWDTITPVKLDESPGFPALADENISTTTMQAGGTSGDVTLTSSTDWFVPEDVGGFYQLTHRRQTAAVSINLVTATTSASQRVLGKWEVFTFGIWDGTLFLEQKQSDNTWVVLRSWMSKKDRNVQAAGTLEREGYLRLRYVGTGTGTTPPRATVEAIDTTIKGLIKVIEYLTPKTVRGRVVRGLHSTLATTEWTEGAWSKKRGFPRALAVHEQRLLVAGSRKQPNTVWGSVTGDLNNFERTTLDDSGLAYQIAAQESNPIVWLASQEGLIIGTEGDEWIMSGGEGPLTATNIAVRRQSRHGSAPIQAQLVASVVLYVQRSGRNLREYIFDFTQQNYVSPDLTQMVEHLLPGGIKQMAYAQNPHTVLWVITQDGDLISCTYNRQASVIAWARHESGCSVESVSAIYGDHGADDVWFCTCRQIGGETRRFIERFDPEHWKRLDQLDQSRLVYLDAAVRRESATPLAEITGLEHLNGSPVRVMADGSERMPRLVEGGRILLERPARIVIVGLPFTTQIQPMPFDIQLRDGTAIGRKWRTPKFTAHFHLTGAASYADGPGAHFYDVPFRTAPQMQGEPPPLFSGLRELQVQAGYRDSVDLVISSEAPSSLNLLALIATTAVYG
jgi:hypothetical protein